MTEVFTKEQIIAAIQFGFDISSEGDNGEFSFTDSEKVGEQSIEAFLAKVKAQEVIK